MGAGGEGGGRWGGAADGWRGQEERDVKNVVVSVAVSLALPLSDTSPARRAGARAREANMARSREREATAKPTAAESARELANGECDNDTECNHVP
jgi:hypothetical protein